MMNSDIYPSEKLLNAVEEIAAISAKLPPSQRSLVDSGELHIRSTALPDGSKEFAVWGIIEYLVFVKETDGSNHLVKYVKADWESEVYKRLSLYRELGGDAEAKDYWGPMVDVGYEAEKPIHTTSEIVSKVKHRIIRCPKCGTENRLPYAPEPGKKYRCGKCQGLLGMQWESMTALPKVSSKANMRTKLSRIAVASVLGVIVVSVIAVVVVVIVSAIQTGDAPFVKANWQRVNLINIEGAQNPSWGQLEAFLLQDTTDEHIYINPNYTCGDFAEQLHNNAEESGIRAALVVVEFQEGAPHALNAFETMDKGMVYIDVTGENPLNYLFTSPLTLGSIPFTGPDSSDKVAYLKIGKPLGFVSLEFTDDNFSYEYYHEYCEPRIKELSTFSVELENYNTDVESYNDFIAAHDLCPSTNLFHVACLSSSNYQKAKTWKARLELEESQLDQEWDTIKGFLWEPMGVVKSVRVYW